MKTIRAIRVILLMIAVCLIAYSYHPDNFDATGKMINSSSNMYALVVIGITFMLSMNSIKDSLMIKPIRVYCLMMGLVFLLYTLLYALNLTYSINEVRTLLISFFALLLGTLLRLRDKEIIAICIAYIVSILLIGYLQITRNIGDFLIEDSYVNTAKNAFGPMIVIAGVLSVLITVSPHLSKLIRFFTAVTAVFALLEVATIRARLATIIFIILSIFILIRYLKTIRVGNKRNQNIVIYFIVVITILVVVFSTLQEYIWDSLTQNKESDFTSGRLEAYYDSIDIFSRSPLFGNLTLQEDIEWVHNYLLLKLSDYGLVLSMPLLILFFYLAYVIIVGLRKSNLFTPHNFGYMVITISFLASLGEPTYPYGPGTTNFLPFVLFGTALSYKYINK